MQLTCRNLSLAYEWKNVITDLSFSIEKGDYLCILGENGSGKSTLIKAMLGLKKPSVGSISFSETNRKRKIGYLPQQTPAQKDFPASVREVVLSGCLNKCNYLPFYTKKQKKEAEKIVASLGLSELQGMCYRNLSGGQQQRVLLARALCAAEDMLLLDEPVSGLDPMASKEMYSIIDRINKAGTTVIMVSHDIHHAIERADYILHLNEEKTFFGKTAEYVKSDLYTKFGGDSKI